VIARSMRDYSFIATAVVSHASLSIVAPPQTKTRGMIAEKAMAEIPLVNGDTLISQSNALGGYTIYTLTIPPAHSVECVTSGENGDAELSLYFSDSDFYCKSENEGSNEDCKMTALARQDKIYAKVLAREAYTALKITCTISEDHVSVRPLTDGQPLSSQSGEGNSTELYYLTVQGGYSVECVISGDNGNVDLFLRFGDPAFPNACASETTSSNEVCSATAPYRMGADVVDNVVLYAEVSADEAYSNLTITCTTSKEPVPPIAIVDGKASSGQYGRHFTSTVYTLSIPAGRFVECETSCNNGDADLYLTFSDDLEDWEECEHTKGSNEVCNATAPAGVNTTTLNAEVYAYSEYFNLAITCTISESPTSSPSVVPTSSPTFAPTPVPIDCQVSGLFDLKCK
jgi:hypothetical protein